MKTVLQPGVLLDCFQKVRANYYECIDAEVHAATYAPLVRPLSYAEPEFTGKYMDLCATLYEEEQDERALANGMKVLESIARNMRGDGYIGCLPAGNELCQFSVWNQAFTLYGLTRMYEATGKKEALELAVRAADWICETFADPSHPEILDAGNAGSQHISCLYALGRIYRLTRNDRYAQFIRKILDHCETTSMNLLSFADILKLMSVKGIEMLVIYLGVLQYGQLCGEATAIEAAQRYWQQVWETQIRNTGNGTLGELWRPCGNQPALLATEERPNETCVAVGWMELSLALFYHQQRACYLDAIEKTLFNHLIGSLKPDGADLAYYQGNYGHKNFRTDEGWYQCCRYRGFTMFTNLPRIMMYDDGQTLIPMVYGSCEYRTEHVTVRQETNYPANGAVHMKADSDAERLMKLRIPAWCRSWSLRVNDQPVFAKAEEGFVLISLPTGHTDILLILDMVLSSEEHEINEKPCLSFHYGPLLLAQDTRFGQLLWTPADASAPLSLADPIPRALVHALCGNVHLVDFASAGSHQPGQDQYTVFIPKLV